MTEMPERDQVATGDHPTADGSPGSPGAPGTPGTPTTSEERPHKDPLRSSRTGRAWAAVVSLGIVLVLLIIFIAQNTRSVTVSFLGWEGRTSLAVALLIATAAGLFLAAVAGTLRIWQLRRRIRKDKKARR